MIVVVVQGTASIQVCEDGRHGEGVWTGELGGPAWRGWDLMTTASGGGAAGV